MSPKSRVVFAAALAVLALGSITALATLRGKPQKEPAGASNKMILAPELALKAEPPPTLLPQAPANVTTTQIAERPIEEILLESGEDPGAVFYMSRIREAIRGGNRVFAEELLRQMKEQNSRSVLVEQAEGLFRDKE